MATSTLTPLRVIVIAGPNGAGKTTFAREFLPNEADCPVFVNADLIAAGLAPFAPESAALQAGRLMLEQLKRHFAARESFAFESTLAGRGYLRQIDRWQAAGYWVKIIFLKLASAEEAIARVAQRVRQGGHGIPENVIRRRFAAGLVNFERRYAPRADAWAVYDNSGAQPVLLDWSENHERQQTTDRAGTRYRPASVTRADAARGAARTRDCRTHRHVAGGKRGRSGAPHSGGARVAHRDAGAGAHGALRDQGVTVFLAKTYQQQVLDSVEAYFRACHELPSPSVAFTATTERLWQQGQPYRPLAGFAADMPYFCLRVPTGGGKTWLAAKSVARINTHLLRCEHSVVLWLTPSKAIREQTLKGLRDRSHPYHAALREAGPVTVLDLDEAKSLTRATLDTSTTVIVTTRQTFQVEDEECRKVTRAAAR